MNFLFFLNSILFGVGLAMDAFSVSLANGLNEPTMKSGKENLIAGLFGFFQFLMPMLGWICIHTLVNAFGVINKFVPWIALILLLYIGGKMIYEGIKNKEESGTTSLDFKSILIQAVATSIDALSVGFTISDLGAGEAIVESLIIGAVTYAISIIGVKLGKTAGTKLAGKAGILGGIILVLIGIEIFIKGMIG